LKGRAKLIRRYAATKLFNHSNSGKPGVKENK